MMTFYMENSQFALGDHGAELFETAVRELIAKKETIVCAFCGGNSITPLLLALSTKNIPWSKVQLFLTDERLVPIDSPDSNFKHLHENLFGKLVENGTLPKKNLHPYIMKDFLPDFGVSLYQKELEMYGNKLDIIIVSAGEDGHIASLFPNLTAVQSKTNTYCVVENAPKPPARRMSLSPCQIQNAHLSIILFRGQVKKTAFDNFMDENSTVLHCPAKLVKQTDKTFVLADIKR